MAVWVRFVDLIPHVTCRVFIDDAYLWVRIDHVHHLQQAFAVTEIWNDLIGQKLNPSKSTLWATSVKSRASARTLFPLIPVALEFDALGTKIYTSHRDAYMFAPERVARIRTDIKNIGALPLPRSVKTSLIVAKVVPQFTYGAEVSDIPKKVLSDIQTDIATVLWHNRPHWRSKMLVFCFFSQPCFVEPKTARAYTAVLNFWRYIHSHPEIITTLQNIFEASIALKQSLVCHVSKALEHFHLRLFPDLSVGIGNQRFEILDVTPRDLRGFLHVMGRQACYEASGAKARKDVSKPSGLLDFNLSTAFYRRYSPPTDCVRSLVPHFESQIVGCTITNDRRAAVGFTDDPTCRFCLCEKESLRHIVYDCPSAPIDIRTAPKHDFGTNFVNFGIFDHPVALCNFRLEWQPWKPDALLDFQPDMPRRTLWTDGSVFFPQNFWVTTGAYAIVDESFTCVRVERVNHVALNSYATELYAVLQAIAISQGPIQIVSDCKTVVSLFSAMISANACDPTWSHLQWWRDIFRIWQMRRCQASEPIQLRWIRAHSCDDIPLHAVTPEVAKQLGMTVQDIVANRVTDDAAKKCALSHVPVDPQLFQSITHEVFVRQALLSRLNQQIGDDVPLLDHFERKDELICEDPLKDMQTRFPNWLWNLQVDQFPWTPTFTEQSHQALMTKLPPSEATSFSDFFSSLRWQVGDNLSTGYVEIAFLFQRRRFTLESIHLESSTFVDLLKKIRKACTTLFSSTGQKVLPGVHHATWAHKCGQAIPKGSILGARPFLENQELLQFACILREGRGQSLKGWAFDLSLCSEALG